MTSCKCCGEPTQMMGTRMCDNCWEIETRIRQIKTIALAKIIKNILPKPTIKLLIKEINE